VDTVPVVDTRPNRSPWIVFAIAATGGYITTLDLSIVNVAFAEIAKTYSGASRADVAWVVTAYNILFGSLLVAGGRTADRFGRKKVFVAGAAVFGLGSIMCTVAPTLELLVAGRAVQGLGGAFLMPATLGLLLSAFPADKRTQVVSLWGGVGALGVASGPTLGAALISVAGWRAAFWLNVPIIVAVIVASRRGLIESAPQDSIDRPDYAGAAMITVALASLALGISQSEHWGWADGRTLGALVLAALIVPVFIRRQARHPEPVVDLSLFRQRSFAVANAASLLFGVAFAAMFLNNVLFVRTVWHYSVLEAGLASCLAPITVALVSGPAGKLATRYGFRPLLVVGPLLFGAAVTADATLLSATPTLGRWIAFGVLLGVGVGCTIPVLASAAVSTLPPQRFAVGGAVNNTARQVGAVLGVAILVAVQGNPTTPEAVMDSFRNGWWLGAGTAATSAAISLLQPRRVVATAAAATASAPSLVGAAAAAH
jgi:EmrB/QacA subfamily drug resistance transporter